MSLYRNPSFSTHDVVDDDGTDPIADHDIDNDIIDNATDPSTEVINPKVSDSINNNKEKPKETIEILNKPSDAPWKQQALPAWQPILTADTVLPAFFLLGIAFIPIGIGLLLSSNTVNEKIINYTSCMEKGHEPPRQCSSLFSSYSDNIIKCECRINFTLDTDFKAPVYFYYGLSGFYQNHRRYVKSKDDHQLLGKILDKDHLTTDCTPFLQSNTTDGIKAIAPCGAIANSLFNDTFKLYYRSGFETDGIGEWVDIIETDISWPSDKEYKFKNPDFKKDSPFQKTYTKPPSWPKPLDELDLHDKSNNGYLNEHLIVWMRTAALPTFRKLWGRINHDQDEKWRTVLPKGKYTLDVDYKFPVVLDKFKGEKLIIISNTSWMGGKNNFLGIAYLTMGGVCIILWISFLFISKKYAQKPKDMIDFGQSTPYIA